MAVEHRLEHAEQIIDPSAHQDVPDITCHPDDWREGLWFSMKTLNTKRVSRAKRPTDVIPVFLQHNLRQGNEDHRHRRPIDAERTKRNSVLRGAPDLHACIEAANSILKPLGIDSCRMDRIVGIEYVMQPPPGWDVPSFYDECLRWVDARHEAVVSAVVHRDQVRPHLHIIVLALLDGKLDGAALSSHENRLAAQLIGFLTHMRKTLNLRPDRDPAETSKPPKTKTAKSPAATFTSTGKGAKSHAAAAKSDAALVERAKAREADLHAHPKNATSYWGSLRERLEALNLLFADAVLAGLFPPTPTRQPNPAPRPLDQPAAPDRGVARGVATFNRISALRRDMPVGFPSSSPTSGP